MWIGPLRASHDSERMNSIPGYESRLCSDADDVFGLVDNPKVEDGAPEVGEYAGFLAVDDNAEP